MGILTRLFDKDRPQPAKYVVGFMLLTLFVSLAFHLYNDIISYQMFQEQQSAGEGRGGIYALLDSFAQNPLNVMNILHYCYVLIAIFLLFRYEALGWLLFVVNLGYYIITYIFWMAVYRSPVQGVLSWLISVVFRLQSPFLLGLISLIYMVAFWYYLQMRKTKQLFQVNGLFANLSFGLPILWFLINYLV